MDADRAARWGRARVIADVPEGGKVTIETRSGDSVNPDDRWSEWMPTAMDNLIQSPSARYLQYRLTLSSNEGKPSPVVREVHLTRMPVNRPPTVAIKAPSGEACVAKKFTIKWEGRDPDQNALVYDVSLSSDLGKSWTTLKSDLTDTKYEWDTAKTADGAYLLRVTASDRRSQPWSPESQNDTLAVTVDNTAAHAAAGDAVHGGGGGPPGEAVGGGDGQADADRERGISRGRGRLARPSVCRAGFAEDGLRLHDRPALGR